MLELIVKTVWLLLPAYTPNNFAVLFGGGKPLDFGKYFIDGRRILGDGKTIRGFIAGVFGGILTAHVQLAIEKIFKFSVYSSLDYLSFIQLIFLLSFGAMFGDSVGSFVKRRFGVERGKSFPILDQLTFLITAYLLASGCNAFYKLFTWDVILVGIVVTPILHLAINVLAYKLGLKDVWW
ncbi:CDP-2,3-bis-(O-geranylgeranyl)-sn-glycerol synthase [Archaeoglobus sp.]